MVPLRCFVRTCSSEKLVTGKKANVNIEAAELEESAMPLDSLFIFYLLWWQCCEPKSLSAKREEGC